MITGVMDPVPGRDSSNGLTIVFLRVVGVIPEMTVLMLFLF